MTNGTTGQTVTVSGTVLNKVLHAVEGIAILVAGVFLVMNGSNIEGSALIGAGVAGLGYSIAPTSVTYTS